uniref:S-adenosyl-L-methionine (SAM)-dependent methyltransferase PhcB n=1 Tax=Thermosporothrix sp. COM3 TaxID=2490863 RepID=A0A455SHN8_9CHLR|nr:S-adenosyl-L-methionine (SAM)-dependent methyltransferase PhcB [Thermosporothrix sp. COM3]
MSHKETIRQAFTRQANAYAANPFITNEESLRRLVETVHPAPQAHVLDVATGPGSIAMAFAEAGCDVIGIDLTDAPLAIAELKRKERGLERLRFQVGDAEQLPFEDQRFDIVVSRFALHHVETPRRMLAEMTRVCRPNGSVVINDLITSEHPARAEYQNRFERLRDPSHTQALSISALLALFTACGLEIEHISTETRPQQLESWLRNAHTPEQQAVEVREMLQRDSEQDLSGTRPYVQDGQLYFSHRIALCIGRKLAH